MGIITATATEAPDLEENKKASNLVKNESANCPMSHWGDTSVSELMDAEDHQYLSMRTLPLPLLIPEVIKSESSDQFYFPQK